MQLQEQMADCQAVAANLPAGSTLIELVRFDVFHFHAKTENRWQPARYLAFILPAQQPDTLQMVDLGTANILDRLVVQSRYFLQSTRAANLNITWGTVPSLKLPTYDNSAAQQLRQHLFEPLRDAIGEAQQLFISPDAYLSVLPFELIPTDETGETLMMDRYAISYLTSGRDLLRSTIETERPATAPLIIADPDFDLSATPATASPSATRENTPPELLQTLDSQGMGRALATGTLGKAVADQLGVKPHLQTDALATHLTADDARPRILLIGTHGLYLPDIEEEPPAPNESWDPLSQAPLPDPMLRSGLAFAGANTWRSGGTLPPEAGKGFLFARDIAGLDLWANELTVLCACETAIGDLSIGEGVFGLRRAFAVAGAKTLLMSLWSVPARASVLLMQHFFANLKQGMGRRDALTAAQNAVRTVTVAQLYQTELGQEILSELLKGEPIPADLVERQGNDKPLAHPYFWGAWICQGDVSPLSF
jgi:CHAT domain-containing protein